MEQKLKYVTILFMDVVGSTTLSQQLDPEEVYQVMEEVLAAHTAIVVNHGGRVLKYAGDSVLAVFGADAAREDDAERAVQCSLAMLAIAKQQGKHVAQRYGHTDFNVRVGLHSGSVLLGGGLDADNSIRGFHVNVAARMEQSAPAGCLRISHATYGHVRGAFDVEAPAPIEVKGVAEPLQTYLVLSSKPRTLRNKTWGLEGVATRMVGRDAELAQLQSAFHRVVQGKWVMVQVVGQAGLGKSRLSYEFENWAEARSEPFYFFQGRAHANTRNQPYGLLRDVLLWRFRIAEGDSPAQARHKLEQSIAPLFSGDGGDALALAHAHVLGHLIGIDFSDSIHVQGIQDDGKQLRTRGFHTGAQLLRRMAQKERMPLVMVLDDFHWADSGTLDFLRYHAQVNADLPTLVLTLSRPLPVRPLADLPQCEELQLKALDQGAASQLAMELLKKLPEVPTALRELLTRGAEGNPFYMEELVKMLIDGGAIVAGESEWTVRPEKLHHLQVPSTLTGVLQARLDSLHPDERTALQHASVIGALFWDQALEEINPEAAARIPDLVQHGLLLPQSQASQEGGQNGLRTYAFAHHLLHQVTYETLLKSHRKALHAKTAQWLARQDVGLGSGFLETTALHFLKAEAPAPACDYFTRAAEYAASRYAHDAALAHAQQGLALLQELTPSAVCTVQALQDWHWRLLCVRERAWDLEGKRQEQQGAIAALQHLADTTQDARLHSEAALRQSNLDLRTGDYAGMEAAARSALAYAQASAEPVHILRCQQRLALSMTYLGDAAAGHALASDGLAQARAQGERALEALFLNALSVIADTQMDVLASLELDRQDLHINRELGNRRNEAIALNNLGNGWLRLGGHALAHTYLQEGLQLVRAVGDRGTEPSLLLNLATLAMREEKDGHALTLARAALDSASAVGSPERVAMAWCTLGHAELALGRQDAAHTAFETALNTPGSDPPTRFDALAGLARVALLRHASDALPYVEAIMTHLAAGGDLDGTESVNWILLVCYQSLQAVGDARAQALLHQAHQNMVAVLDTLTDAGQRIDFLHNVPEHRAITAAWNAQR
jgi:class 3 adenylate cyclase/tetratricopeptide (TPR) repeat protein